MALTKEQQESLALAVSTAFTPAAPINERDLFAGRLDQVRRVVDAINQRGQHVIIFGERGVGKTSLANVLTAFIQRVILAPRVNCDAADDYSSIWRKVFGDIEFTLKQRAPGFTGEDKVTRVPLTKSLPEKITPETVRQTLELLGAQGLMIIVLDEFDRLTDFQVRRLIADTIKTLSDHSILATLVLVGVADTVDALIEEHQSIERALVQVQMPRMSVEELEEIIHKGLARLNITIQPEALRRITLLSRGLPHYTHLLGLHAAREAIDGGTEIIELKHVAGAVSKALTQAQQTIRSAYHKATMSAQKDSLYDRVLLACALAPTDELDYFAAADVRGPMSRIMGKRYDIPSFGRHLHHFCEPDRGRVLQRTGSKRRFRFRFANPLLQPFVIMQGIADGLINGRELEEMSSVAEGARASETLPQQARLL